MSRAPYTLEWVAAHALTRGLTVTAAVGLPRDSRRRFKSGWLVLGRIERLAPRGDRHWFPTLSYVAKVLGIPRPPGGGG